MPEHNQAPLLFSLTQKPFNHFAAILGIRFTQASAFPLSTSLFTLWISSSSETIGGVHINLFLHPFQLHKCNQLHKCIRDICVKLFHPHLAEITYILDTRQALPP